MASIRTSFTMLLSVFTVYCSSPTGTSHTASALAADQVGKQQTLVIALGGFSGGDRTASLEINSLTNNSNYYGTSMPEARNIFASAVFSNTIYVTGGGGGPRFGYTCRNALWAYNIANDSWTTDLPSAPTTMCGSTAAVVRGKVFVIGGTATARDDYLTQVYAYKTSAHKWETLTTPVPQISSLPCAVSPDGKDLYYMPEGALWYLEDGKTVWQSRRSPATWRRGAACTVLGNNSILVAGGADYDGKVLDTVEVYDIFHDNWTTVTPMLSVRGTASAATMPDKNQVLVCGGSDQLYRPLTLCEMYDQEKNVWAAAGFNLTMARETFGMFTAQADE